MYDGMLVKQTIHPASYDAGTITGQAVDNAFPSDPSGFNKALILLTVGALGDNGTLDVKLQHSKDGREWADIPGAAFSQVTADHDETSYLMHLSLILRGRYVRAVAEATAAASFGVTVMLYEGYLRPVPQDHAPVLVADVGV